MLTFESNFPFSFPALCVLFVDAVRKLTRNDRIAHHSFHVGHAYGSDYLGANGSVPMVRQSRWG